MNNSGFFSLAIAVVLGLGSAGYFVSQTMYNAKVALNTAEAKGLAERRVKADRVHWNISFSVQGESKDQIAQLYQQAEAQQKIIVDLLKSEGLQEDEIEVGVLDYRAYQYRNDKQEIVDESHSLDGVIGVETTKVDMIKPIRTKVSKLIAQGIDIENRAPQYRFTKLNEIKPDMLRDATRNARIAANEFAENAGVTVGGIRSARQGGFIVTDAGEEYGDSAKIEKDVRVVTTITFFLTE